MNLLGILTKIEEWMDRVSGYIVTDTNDSRTWHDGILAVCRPDPASGRRTLHILRDVVHEVLNEEDQELLLSNGLTPRKTEYRTRLGTYRAKTFDVLLDDLEQLAYEDVGTANKEHQLHGQIRTLKRELKLMRDARLMDEQLVALIHGTMDAAATRKPLKPLHIPKKNAKNLAGWATLFLSDWHWDEVVNPAEIEFLNEYNHDIAVKRAAHTFETTGDLLLNHMAGAYYDGIVVALGGDMLSGNIHAELRETNSAPITESILTCSEHIAQGIRTLAKEFPQVYVPCVVGNHGRYDRKPRMKGRVQENYDWLVYQLIARDLRDLQNVRVHVSEAADVQYDLYGHVYRLTHGDQFRGGDGIAGKWPTLFRGDFKKRKRSVKTGGGGYNTLMMGHWHSYGVLDGLIVNGSLKGYDEYAYIANFDYEPPTQGLWCTHPDYGMTAQWPVYSDGERKAVEDNSFSGAKVHQRRK